MTTLYEKLQEKVQERVHREIKTQLQHAMDLDSLADAIVENGYRQIEEAIEGMQDMFCDEAGSQMIDEALENLSGRQFSMEEFLDQEDWS